MKRVRVLLAAGVLVLGSLAVAGPVSAVSYTNCADFEPPTHTYFVGTTFGHVSGENGVAAHIDPDGGFHDCIDTNGLDVNSGSWAFVAIASTNGDPNAIIQIGYAYCHQPSYCPVQGSLRYFWAYGGCGQQMLVYDLGAANGGGHHFKLMWRSSNDYAVYIDGLPKAAVLTSNSRISCWINGGKQSQWLGERHDKSDGLGTSVTPDLHFYTHQRKINGVWQSSYPSCNIDIGDNQFCDQWGTPEQELWTVF